MALPSGHCRPSLGGHGGSAGDRGARARMLRGTGSRRPGPVKASPQTRPAGRAGRGGGRPCLGRSGSRPWPTGHRVALFAGSPRIPFSEDAPGKQGTVTAPAEKEDERGKWKSQRAATGRSAHAVLSLELRFRRLFPKPPGKLRREAHRMAQEDPRTPRGEGMASCPAEGAA